MSPSHQHTPLVGVFDSGVGGLSVLKALHQQLPAHDLLYVADSGHAPYGERSDEFITERTPLSRAHLDELLELAAGGIAQLRSAQAAAVEDAA